MAYTVMQISNSNNEEAYNRILEEKKMSLAIDNLVEKKLAAREAEGRTQGRVEGLLEGRREGQRELLTRLKESGIISAEQAAMVQGWSF